MQNNNIKMHNIIKKLKNSLFPPLQTEFELGSAFSQIKMLQQAQKNKLILEGKINGKCAGICAEYALMHKAGVMSGKEPITKWPTPFLRAIITLIHGQDSIAIKTIKSHVKNNSENNIQRILLNQEAMQKTYNNPSRTVADKVGDTVMQNFNKGQNLVSVTLCKNQSNVAGHIIAIRKVGDDQYRIFDPNFGETRNLTAKKMTKFLDQITEHYEYAKSGGVIVEDLHQKTENCYAISGRNINKDVQQINKDFAKEKIINDTEKNKEDHDRNTISSHRSKSYRVL